jgi:hypothetical protein
MVCKKRHQCHGKAWKKVPHRGASDELPAVVGFMCRTRPHQSSPSDNKTLGVPDTRARMHLVHLVLHPFQHGFAKQGYLPLDIAG